MAELLRLDKAAPARRPFGGWVETPAARDIARSLQQVACADEPEMTMIAGGPGTGKTTEAERFCAELGQDAIYIEAARGEGTPWNFALSLANLWGYGALRFGSLAEARQLIAGNIRSGTVLLIDEAQYLGQKNRKTGEFGEALEWVRATATAGGFHVVFCGDLTLPKTIGAFPQLQSRMRRPVIIEHVSKADVAAIVAETCFDHEWAIDALLAVARLKGGLRNVRNVAQLAELFAGSEQPTPGHLKAAIADMKLDGRAK